MKTVLDDLALNGGQPAFDDVLHVGRPNLGDRDKLLTRIHAALDRDWLTNDGPLVRDFERALAEHTGAKHCVAICNGTVALELAIRAAGLAGEVIVPSFTFVATAHALLWQGITPVFCDIDPATHTIDPNRLEDLISPRTTGIIGVHLWGQPCDIESLAAIADRRGLTLLFDAAHAFGSRYRGQMIGTFGEAEIFSFHATKFVNALEGGAVATNNDDLAERLRLTRNFGFAGYDNVVCLGTNGKMNEFSAAMGLSSLDSMAEFSWINRRNYSVYSQALEDISGVRLLEFPEGNEVNHQYVVVEVSCGDGGLSRDCLMEILWAENVRARRYFYPGVHNVEPYRSLFPEAGLFLPQTERLARKVLVLPTGSSIAPPQIEAICDLIRFAVSHGPEIQVRVAAEAAGATR